MNHEPLTLTPEEQFILTCLRTEFSGGGYDSFPAFDYESFDWDMVYKKSTEWHIAELLYKIIKKQASFLKTAKIPEHFLERMKLKYFMSCVAYDSMFKSLYEVLEVFHKAGIKVILLKGSHMAQFVYEDAGVRPMGDIDILVRKEDLSKAEELLLQIGYNNQQKSTKAKSHLHLPYFIHPEGNVPLELHWTITKPIWRFNIDLEGIWERAKTVRKDGIDMLVFSPEDLLLYLSLHAVYQHNLRVLGLVPYCDIAAIIHNTSNRKQIPHKNMSSWKRGGGEGGCENTNNNKEVITQKYSSYCSEVDWEQLQERAHEWGIAKYLYLSLYLCHEILGANVPEGIISAFTSEPSNKKIASEAIKRVLSIKAEKSPFTDAPHLFYDDFHPHNNPMRRMLFAFQRIFIPPEKLAAYHSLPANSKRIYLYYSIRFFSLPYRYFLYYVRFYVYWLIYKKGQVYGDNLDLWLLAADSKKGIFSNRK